MCKDNIGKCRQKVQEKLAANLAGPFEKYIPQFWVQDILKEIGVRFREAVFSPLGNDMGVHRASSGPGPIVQPSLGQDSMPSFAVGPQIHFNRHWRLLQGSTTAAGTTV